MQIPLHETSMGQNAFCYHEAKLWNEISREVEIDVVFGQRWLNVVACEPSMKIFQSENR